MSSFDIFKQRWNLMENLIIKFYTIIFRKGI
jgi:hypothetical protein